MSKITNDSPVMHRMPYTCSHMATVGVKVQTQLPDWTCSIHPHEANVHCTAMHQHDHFFMLGSTVHFCAAINKPTSLTPSNVLQSSTSHVVNYCINYWWQLLLGSSVPITVSLLLHNHVELRLQKLWYYGTSICYYSLMSNRTVSGAERVLLKYRH